MGRDAEDWPPSAWVGGNVVDAGGVCKAFARVPVLYPLTFSLPPGMGLALLGPNGSGKSTLLRLLAGASAPSAGRLSVCGYELPSERQAAMRCCALLGHDSYLYDDLTGLENLRYFGAMAELDTADVELAETLSAVGLDPASMDRVRAYSAGMKRRLGLARVLLTKPPLLLLDEPHAALDAAGAALVDDMVRRALASGRSAVIASHDWERTLGLCNRALLLERGRAIYYGAAAMLRERAPMWVVQGGAS